MTKRTRKRLDALLAPVIREQAEEERIGHRRLIGGPPGVTPTD